MPLVLPKLYVILDAALLKDTARSCVRVMSDEGVRLFQYRDKTASSRELLTLSRELADWLIPRDILFFVNDRADVALLAGASGVHLGQDDLGTEEGRTVLGLAKFVGISTHNVEQFRRAADSSADYIAVGPIFPTATKANPDPLVGIEFVRQVRPMTRKPIVAIGGITLERAAEVIDAGADSVAVIGDILRAGNPGKRARQYVDLLDGLPRPSQPQDASNG